MRLVVIILVGLALVPSQPVFADWTDKIAGTAIPFPTPNPFLSLPDKRDRLAKKAEKTTEPITSPPLASRLKACPAVISGRVTATYLPAIRTAQLCGDDAPLLVTAIHGVTLSPPARMNCQMTGAVADWFLKVKETAHAMFSKNIKTTGTASSYVCRRRNNKVDGKFSEHATMNALDISVFVLDGGQRVSILDHWDKGAETPTDPKARFLRAVHGSACKIFTTTLGPEANTSHENHFHLDLGCHGKRCTFKLCE